MPPRACSGTSVSSSRSWRSGSPRGRWCIACSAAKVSARCRRSRCRSRRPRSARRTGARDRPCSPSSSPRTSSRRCSRPGEASARTLWRLVPITMLWANLHGGYVIGLVLIAMFGAAQWWDRSDTRGPSWRHVAIVGACAFLVAGVNPYTYKLWRYPLIVPGGSNPSLVSGSTSGSRRTSTRCATCHSRC